MIQGWLIIHEFYSVSVGTFVLTNTSAQPALADWTGAAVCDRLLRVGTAQGKPGRDGWFAGLDIMGLLDDLEFLYCIHDVMVDS